MNDTGELHRKINQVVKDVSYMRGQWDSKMPTFATDDSVQLAITTHVAEKHTRNGRQNTTSSTRIKIQSEVDKVGWKVIGILSGAVVALTAAIWFIIKVSS